MASIEHTIEVPQQPPTILRSSPPPPQPMAAVPPVPEQPKEQGVNIIKLEEPEELNVMSTIKRTRAQERNEEMKSGTADEPKKRKKKAKEDEAESSKKKKSRRPQRVISIDDFPLDEESSDESFYANEESYTSKESSMEVMGLVFQQPQAKGSSTSKEVEVVAQVEPMLEEQLRKMLAKDLTKEEEEDCINMFKSAQKLRRLGVVQQETLLAKVNKLLKADFIYPGTNSEWVSPVVLTPKKNGANDETPMLVNYLVTKHQQAMANLALQGEVQQQLHAYGILPTHQEKGDPVKSLGETSKRGFSTAREGENPYQELRNLLLDDSHPSRRRGHAQHEEPPSKEKERSKSPAKSMKDDVAPQRRRAQRSPTPTKRKRSPRSPPHRESKREEKNSKKIKERNRSPSSPSSSPPSSLDESGGYSSKESPRRGHRGSHIFFQSVERNPGPTSDEITCILLDMIAAGIHTSTLTLEWAMAELLKSPHCLEKLRREIDDAARFDIGEKRQYNILNDADVAKLSYLKCVVKEVARLHPVLPLPVPRFSTAECKIKGYSIPARTMVFVNVWAIGRDDQAWPKAGEFRPERFHEQEVDLRGQHYELLPFGSGRRICLGLPLALSVVEVTLANLVHRFDWQLPPGVTPLSISMQEKGGFTNHKATPILAIPKPRLLE
ncbi:hypothetical protein L7F22_022049 [Adiantum nelumboides]|nr:hypothetical protein [Adiantum nelumboides]